MGAKGGFRPGEHAISHRVVMPFACPATDNSDSPTTFDIRATFVRDATNTQNSLSFIKGLVGHWGG